MTEGLQINHAQRVAVLVDGNNIEMSVASEYGDKCAVNYDTLIPKILNDRGLVKFFYFREGTVISPSFADRLHRNFYGITKNFPKSVDIPLTIEAVQLSDKVDTIILFSGDRDYIELINMLQRKGVRVELCSMKKSTSIEMSSLADFQHFIGHSDTFEIK